MRTFAVAMKSCARPSLHCVRLYAKRRKVLTGHVMRTLEDRVGRDGVKEEEDGVKSLVKK